MTNLPMRNEDDYIIDAAKGDVGFGRILTFVKGEYFLDKEEVPLESEFKVHTREWVQVWINFDTRPIIQKIYRVARGQKAPERESLGDLDKSKWQLGFNSQLKDPWVLQYLVPFESLETGEIVAFRASSFGGRRAIAELASLCAFKSKRGEPSLPTIKLDKSSFTSKNYGKVQQPAFTIIGFDNDSGARHEINVDKLGNGSGGSDGAAAPIDEDLIPF
jgi:hypothetical protein